jgi:hypothetical protein
MNGKLQLVAGGNCNNFAPAWEKDSHALIFASDCGRGIGMPVLYRANLSSQTRSNSGFGVFTAAKSSVITIAYPSCFACKNHLPVEKYPFSVELSVFVGIVSFANRCQEVIDDKVGYLTAHALAAGQVGAEMDAGENSA